MGFWNRKGLLASGLLLVVVGVACDNSVECGKQAPQVTPMVVSVGRDSVTIGWIQPDSAELWEYDMGLAEDSTAGNEIKGTNAGSVLGLRDTSYTFHSLKPATWYKSIVITGPIDSASNYAPSSSFPPLRFKTLD